MFNAFPEEGAAFGAHIAVEYNQGVTNWQVSPGGAVLEELCGQALCRLFGLPADSEATMMYSGTYANHQAVYMALHRYAESRGVDLGREGLAGFDEPGRLAVVTSADSHFSLKHTVRTLGLGDRSLVPIDLDGNRRLDIQSLRDALAAVKDSRDVFAAVTTAGTTSTGAVDPIAEVADVCEELGIWHHVDGAYGLAYGLVPEWAHLFNGIDRADSVSWDPHKQLGVPIPNSVLFVKNPDDFDRMALFSSYFNRKEATEPNPGVKSMPSTRPFSALPLVTSLRHQGLARVRQRLRVPLEAIRDLAGYLNEQPDFETSHAPDTGILCYRIVPQGVSISDARLDDLQKRVYETIMKEGRRTISLSEVNQRSVLRSVAVSPAVTFEALKDTIADVRRIAGELTKHD
jgi:L-2,4-diaminobutyrate decarboxylase